MTDLFDMAVAAKLAGGSGGGEAVLKTKTVTANGVYNASSDHADGYSKVTVNVPSPPAPVLVTKNIGANGTYAASGDNADGYSSVTVAVPTPEPPVLTTKNIAANGTYTAADDNADGYSAVNVAVPTPAPPVLISKSVSANGTYTAASDSADGYSAVTVDVPLVADGNLFDFTKKRVENGYRNHMALDSHDSDPQTYELDMSGYAPTCYISEYIPVEAGVKYFLVRPEFTWRGSGIVIYNANKEIISYLESLNESYKEITIPSGGAFVRFTVADTTGISLTTCPEYERLVSFCRA